MRDQRFRGLRKKMKICVFFSFLMAFFSPASAYSLTVKDSLGRIVTLKTEPLRIVSLAPSITETLYFLGLGNRLVGVTQFSNFPAEASAKPKIGSYINLNAERIVSLKPDLAIGTADGNEPSIVKTLDEAGIPVFIVNQREVRDVIDSIAELGQLCGIGEKAKILSKGLSERVENVYMKTKGLERPLVFLQINVTGDAT